ncbi:MAG TPA: tetratricopeptide repeat protein [Candidatus Nitrosocosmicus sp.]|nr:tetratricopeptide repeat protein [Candidatus Nitrosocosmicus sp.]
MSNELYVAFREAIDCPEDQIDLGRAALAIASQEYPDLKIDDYLSRLDGLGQVVELRIGDERNPYRIIAALNTVLFKELGFQGNRSEYYDPKNSFLNDVITRKKGIPISLSVVYMEVARRVGLSLEGIGFPGHFLVKYDDGDVEILIDVFDGGEIRAREDLDRMLQQLYRGQVSYQPGFVAALGKRDILRRMLNNLKWIYLERGEPLKTLSVLDQLVILDPSAASEIRDRGLLYITLECYAQALDDLESYLRLTPGAEDAAMIKAQIESVRHRYVQIH